MTSPPGRGLTWNATSRPGRPQKWQADGRETRYTVAPDGGTFLVSAYALGYRHGDRAVTDLLFTDSGHPTLATALAWAEIYEGLPPGAHRRSEAHSRSTRD